MKGKVLAGSRGDYYLLCFREDQCVCKPLLHLLYFNRFENQAGLRKKKQRSDALTFCEKAKIPLRLLFSLLALTVQQTTQISTIDSACSPQCISLLSPPRRVKRSTVAGGRETSRGGATPQYSIFCSFICISVFTFRSVSCRQNLSATSICSE